MSHLRDFARDRLQVGATLPGAGLEGLGRFKPISAAPPEPNRAGVRGTDRGFTAGASALGSAQIASLFRAEIQPGKVAGGQHHRGFIATGRADYCAGGAAQNPSLYAAVGARGRTQPGVVCGL